MDAELLSEVWLELNGGRQHGLTLRQEKVSEQTDVSSAQSAEEKPYREPRAHFANDDEKAAHEKMLESITDPIWHELSGK